MIFYFDDFVIREGFKFDDFKIGVDTIFTPPALENPASTQDVLQGKEFIDGDGVVETGVSFLDEVKVTPTIEDQTIVPVEENQIGFDRVVVNKVTSKIDGNIQPENIVKDIEILGVRGEFDGKILPELDNPAAVTDVLSGKEYIDENGQKQTGTMPNPIPEKGFVFENYDSDGYPTAGRFVGEWSGALPRFEHFFKPTAYGRSVTSLTIPEGITIISASSLASCSSLKTILLPKTVTTIQSYAFFASGVTSITIPESFTSWGNGINHFNGSSLITVIFEGHCPDIPKNCFWKCNNINYFDFSNCTSVPTLYSAGSLGHASGCVIKVPSALLSEWQNATNWVDLTDVVWEGV